VAQPVLTFTPIPSPESGDVVIDYTVEDASVHPVTMQFRYSTDGGTTFNVCSESVDPSSEGTLNISTGPSGSPASHRFVWDAEFDLSALIATVIIEITADDGVGGVTTILTNSFSFVNSTLAGSPTVWPGVFVLNNTKPVGKFIFPNPSTSPSPTPVALQTGTILVQYNLEDEESDPVDIEFEYSLDDGKSWKPCTEGSGGDGRVGLSTLPNASGGVDHVFAWKSDEDVRSGRVTLRGKPKDPYEEGDYFLSEPFWVENVKDGWVPKLVPLPVYQHDPDSVIKFYADLVEAFRIRNAKDILDFEDLYDVEKAPPHWLHLLANRIAMRIDQNFPVAIRRRQLRQAIQWYKDKGLEGSFMARFAALGYEAFITELWTDGFNCSDSDLGVDWMPHSRIDLTVLRFDSNSPIDPTNITQLLEYAEEVRPIHVLIRDVIPGVLNVDSFDVPDDEDVTVSVYPIMTVEGTYDPNTQYVPHDRIDQPAWIPTAGVGLQYFNGTRAPVRFNSSSGPPPLVYLKYAGDRDPFTDESFDFEERPQIGPPFRDVITYGAMAAGGFTYGDGSSWYDGDQTTISAFDTLNNLLPGYPITV